MRTCILIAAACLLLPLAARAQEIPRDDPLWLAYAPLLERALLEDPQTAVPYHGPVPDAWLDALEPQFGDDPRYWELRWWQAVVWWYPRHDEVAQAFRDGSLVAEAAHWLRRGAERGALRFDGAALLYQADRDALRRLWDRYFDGTASAEDVEYMAQFGSMAQPGIAYEHALAELSEALISAYPNQAWPRYERAILHFEYGQWEIGLREMEAGNASPVNRLPTPFPLSFVQVLLRSDDTVQHEVAVGVVGFQAFGMPSTSFNQIKEHARDQIVRWNLGAPFDEISPWHRYACRIGTAEGAMSIHILVAATIDDMLMRYWIIESPDSFDLHQREALFNLNRRMREPRNVFRFVDDGFAELLAATDVAGNTDDVRSIYKAIFANLKQQHERTQLAAGYFERAYDFDFQSFSEADKQTGE